MIEHCIVFPGHFGNKSSSTLPGFCKTADVFWSLYKEFVGILRSLFQPYPFSPMFFQLQPFALCPKISQHMWQVQKSRNKQVQMIFDKGFGIHHVGSLSTPALKGCCGGELTRLFSALGSNRFQTKMTWNKSENFPQFRVNVFWIPIFQDLFIPFPWYLSEGYYPLLRFFFVVYCKIVSMRDYAGVLGEWSNYHATQCTHFWPSTV